jgi:hypothetical protein
MGDPGTLQMLLRGLDRGPALPLPFSHSPASSSADLALFRCRGARLNPDGFFGGTTGPLRWALQRFNGTVQFVSFGDQKRQDLVDGHQN